MLRSRSKAVLGDKEIKKLVTSLARSAKNLKGKEQEVINALSKFSVVKGSASARRFRDAGQQLGTPSINEEKELDRMKVLAGIK